MKFILPELSEKIKNNLTNLKEGTEVRIVHNPEISITQAKIDVYVFLEKKEEYDDEAFSIIETIKAYDEDLVAYVVIHDGEENHTYADPRVINP